MKHLILIILIQFSFICFGQESIENNGEMCRLLNEMINNDQLYRSGEILGGSFGTENNSSKKEIDSVWSLQIKIDNRNTEKLIELTKKYGWISDERIDCPKLNIWLIFRHSQKKYFPEILELITKEHEAKRLNDFHYRLIKNHLEGRPKM
ncbi:hypothetical protein [Gaetbulibacter jejuensis]|uniref:Homing endonuclease LAGLIDADG domain-containing protein n=1 Tax=Gaetbulibacter jejuensis TaxID=584607 RepID=A0ABN1JQC6_9FLAO